jgi:hypothetical protein
MEGLAKMAVANKASKYEKYVVRKPFLPGSPGREKFAINGTEHFPELGYWFRAFYVAEPFVMEKPHTHDYDQVFHVMGTNPKDITQLDAEVEIYLGKEGEKVVITSPSIIYVPKGMIHCPVNFKTIKKPLMWINVALVKGDYVKTLLNGKQEGMPPGQ